MSGVVGLVAFAALAFAATAFGFIFFTAAAFFAAAAFGLVFAFAAAAFFFAAATVLAMSVYKTVIAAVEFLGCKQRAVGVG